MATKRQERQLQRQRGAGTRQIKNAGFDLLFPGQEKIAYAPLQPHASGRSHRTPLPELLPQPSRRSRATPRPALPPQRSTRRTPAPEVSTEQPSSKVTSSIPNIKKRGRPKIVRGAEEDEADEERGLDVAPKKRKLNTTSRRKVSPKEPTAGDDELTRPDIQAKDFQLLDHHTSSLPTIGIKKRRKRKSIGQQSIRKAKSQGKDTLTTPQLPQKRGPKPKSSQPLQVVVTPTPEPPGYSAIITSGNQDREQSQATELVKAVEGGAEDGERPKDRRDEVETAQLKSDIKRRELIQKRPKRRVNSEITKVHVPELSNGKAAPAEQVQPKTKAKRGPKPGKTAETVGKIEQLQNPTDEYQAENSQSGEKVTGGSKEAAGETSQEVTSVTKATGSRNKPKPRRKKRKSIGQQTGRPKKKATDIAIPSSPMEREAPVTKTAKNPKSRTLVTAPSSTRPKAKTNKLPVPAEEVDPIVIDNTPNDQPEPLPAQKKRGRPRKADAPNLPPPTTEPTHPRIHKPKPTNPTTARKPPKNTIPITFYAPPSPSASDSETMHDSLSNPAPKAAIPKTINAVDVLSQTCLEILAQTSTSLAEKAHSSPDQRAVYNRRKKTVDFYSDELQDRLFHLTTTLNTNTSLTAQLRKAVAEERALKKEVKGLEAERKISKQRREEVVKAKKAKELEKMLEGIENAVRKGRELEDAAMAVEG